MILYTIHKQQTSQAPLIFKTSQIKSSPKFRQLMLQDLYNRLKLEQYAVTTQTFLKINLTFLIGLFISYFNLLYIVINFQSFCSYDKKNGIEKRVYPTTEMLVFLLVRSGFLLSFISFYKIYQASDQPSHLFSISTNMRDRQ